MDNAIYATLTRQAGLRREMQVIANNIANASTDGFQKEGLVFSEYVQRMDDSDLSLSMAHAEGRMIDRAQGQLTRTNGTFDLAIEGDGYFMVEAPNGPELTRAGHFTPNADGELIASDGARLLDIGGAPVFVPPDAMSVGVAADGTLSADGRAITQIGIYMPGDVNEMRRSAGVRFSVDGVVQPLEGARVVQGFIESSNVDPVTEVARMIEVQRAYEQSAKFISNEHDRILSAIDILGR
ncbi:flagellar hook-basal body complex protein [Qingshengfaniella alkalisoli]|uniref:Flagellar basal-body rod protein FlgF n=1 Tax=Qingshengfaniella alkalisoli TaxID=2599296 RepID=A0A5B8IWU3_9RHOB|nr:flagellar hook-basal body complex protein [Qingshengfaniella alkalisoli]QDY70154.1 flagellar hook-basal body complex protein [Qingshengfaniella alkalisoli]